MTDAEDYHVKSSISVSNIEANLSETKYKVVDKLRDGLVSHLAHYRIQEERKEYSTTYYIDAYVFSPDEFWRIVQDEAMNLNSRFSIQK